jgi:hypothetical protein
MSKINISINLLIIYNIILLKIRSVFFLIVVFLHLKLVTDQI